MRVAPAFRHEAQLDNDTPVTRGPATMKAGDEISVDLFAAGAGGH